MIKISLVIVISLVAGTLANAQTKVANFSYGKPGTDTYEGMSFWIKDGKRQDINYRYGKDRKEVNVTYAGKSLTGGTTGFTIRFPNNTVLTVIPSGTTLKVTNPKTNYAKTFAWEYEGPINGIGTFCNVCAQDEKEAMKLMKGYYFK